MHWLAVLLHPLVGGTLEGVFKGWAVDLWDASEAIKDAVRLIKPLRVAQAGERVERNPALATVRRTTLRSRGASVAIARAIR